MRKKVLTGCTWLLAGALLIASSCKKSEDPAPPATTTTTTTTDANPEKTSSSDESDVQAAADGALNDANTTLSSTTGVNKMETEIVVGAKVDTTYLKAGGYITITYNGAGEDPNKTRSGSIILKKLTPTKRWKDMGASFLVSFNNYKTTNLKSNKSVTLNGYKKFTNKTGGRVADLYSTTSGVTSVAFSAHGKLSITFDNGSSRDWFVTRLTTYSKSNNSLIVKIDGDTTIAGFPGNVVEGGKNRNNETFTNVISTPIEYHKPMPNSTSPCNFPKPYAGVRTHFGDHSYTMTLGLDSTGAVIQPGICPMSSSFRIDWVKDKLPKTILIKNY